MEGHAAPASPESPERAAGDAGHAAGVSLPRPLLSPPLLYFVDQDEWRYTHRDKT